MTRRDARTRKSKWVSLRHRTVPRWIVWVRGDARKLYNRDWWIEIPQ